MYLKLVCSVFLTLLFFTFQAQAQAVGTEVPRVEIDEVEYTGEYSVVFNAGNYWIIAKRTPTGFILPETLANTEWLEFYVLVGKHKLEFSNVHSSKFTTDWTIGVDEKPYSEENVDKKYAKRTFSVYYIKFQGNGLGTRLTVTRFQGRP